MPQVSNRAFELLCNAVRDSDLPENIKLALCRSIDAQDLSQLNDAKLLLLRCDSDDQNQEDSSS